MFRLTLTCGNMWNGVGNKTSKNMIITKAISRHSDKKVTNKPYDELLKDADVMSHCLYNHNFTVSE